MFDLSALLGGMGKKLGMLGQRPGGMMPPGPGMMAQQAPGAVPNLGMGGAMQPPQPQPGAQPPLTPAQRLGGLFTDLGKQGQDAPQQQLTPMQSAAPQGGSLLELLRRSQMGAR